MSISALTRSFDHSVPDAPPCSIKNLIRRISLVATSLFHVMSGLFYISCFCISLIPPIRFFVSSSLTHDIKAKITTHFFQSYSDFGRAFSADAHEAGANRATDPQVEEEHNFLAFNGNELIEGNVVQENFTPQVYEHLPKKTYRNRILITDFLQSNHSQFVKFVVEATASIYL